MEVGNLNQFNMAIHFLLCFWFIFFFFDLGLASDLAGSFWKPASLLVLMALLFPDSFLADCAAFVMFLIYLSSRVFPRSLLFSCLCSSSPLYLLPWRAGCFVIILIIDERAVCISSYVRRIFSGFWPLLFLELCFNYECFLMLYLKIMFYFFL